MTAVSRFSVSTVVAALLFAAAACQASAATEIEGVKFDDTMAVAGKSLVLNGAGVRQKFVVKVYAAGLYLQEHKSTVDGVMKVEGPRRMRLVMLRDLSTEDLGSAFMVALNSNINDADKAKIVAQISKYGELFGHTDRLKKGDTLDTDWIPGVGNQCYLNGKKIGPAIPDILFYNSVLRVWLGDKPVDPGLKPKLLAPADKK